MLVVAAAMAAQGAPALAKVFLTQQEALALAFPNCSVERQTAFLTAAQLGEATRVAGEEMGSALVVRYVARRDGNLVGTAYFDTHRVRTLPETLMVVIDAAGKVRRIEVLTFDEPGEYLPRAPWYGQFPGRALDDELALEFGIRAVTGATLTARATTAAVRRVLALHQVVEAGAR